MSDIQENLASPPIDDEPPLYFYLSGTQPTPSTAQSEKQKGKQKENAIYSDESDFIPKFGSSGNFSQSLQDNPIPQPPPDENESNEDEKPSNSVVRIRQPRDTAWAFLFCGSLLAMLAIAVVIHVQGSRNFPPLDGTIPNLLYLTLRQSIGIVALLSFLGVVFGGLLIFFFRFFIRVTVWGTICFAPAALLASSIWCFASASSPQKDSNTAMIILGLICLLSSFVLVGFIAYMRKRIDTSVAFLKLACVVLKERPSLFFVSVVFSFLYILFSIFWYWNFAWAFLLGKAEYHDGQVSWILDPNSYVVSLYLVFTYIWTSAVINYAQTYILSEVTCDWYFHRDDMSSSKPLADATKHAFTTSFGSICLGSLIYSSLVFLQFVLDHITRRLPNGQTRMARCLIGVVHSIGRLIDSMNKFALSYCALSGESFCKSSRVTFSIFRKNLMDRVAIASLSHLALTFWVVALSLIFGLTLFTYTSQSLGSIYGWVSGSLSFMVCYFILRFYACIILSISDSLFLCYSIEYDANSALLGEGKPAANQIVFQTLETIFRQAQNVVVYDAED